MSKRSYIQIEKDYEIIKKFINENGEISSFKEISESVGLTESQVRTSLEKHPRVYSKLKQSIAENRENKIIKKNLNSSQTQETKISQPRPSRFVIDSSIAGIDGLRDMIEKICSEGSEIVLTSITIQELDKMQKFKDNDGFDARWILGKAALNPKTFQCVHINDTFGNPDECIVRYCVSQKDVILITSDKAMALSARSLGVYTNFLKHEYTKKVYSFSPCNEKSKIKTLYVARKIGGNLLIKQFSTEFRSVRVISNGIEYNDGQLELKIGDDVLIATRKDGYLTFAHYRISSLEQENNCKLIFSKRIYTSSEIKDLPIASYKSFMRDFRRKVNF